MNTVVFDYHFNMRASYKAFLLGILFTSVTWGVVLYFYFSLSPITNSPVYSFPSSKPLTQTGKPSTSLDPAVQSNRLDESEELNYDYGKANRFSKNKTTKKSDSKLNSLETNLGLVRNKEDQKIREKGYSQHAFNVLVSSRLDYHRELPDSRHKMYNSFFFNPNFVTT